MDEQRMIVNPPAKFKSAVWKYFGFPKADGKTAEDMTICRLCEHTIKYTCKNTSNMAVHLKRKHSISITATVSSSSTQDQPATLTTPPGKPPSSSSNNQMSIQQSFMTKLAPGSTRAQLITRNLALFIATDLRPFSIVQSKAFKQLLYSLEPKYELPSRTTIAEKVVPKLYADVRKEIEADIKRAQTVSITADGWTSRATESYVTITAHYLDHKWVMQNKVLQTRPLHESHTGLNIAQVLTEAVNEWHLSRPHGLQPLTSDSAANMLLAGKIADFNPHIQCFAHIINLAAQRALKLNDVQRLLGRVRKVVAFFHKSSTANHQLKLKQGLLQLPQHKLLMEVKTRWNSAYQMLERYLEQQPAIMAALMSPEIPKKDKDLDTLSASDITTAEYLVKTLEPLKTVTTVLCDASMPTLPMVQPTLHHLKLSMRPLETDPTTVRHAKAAVLSDLESRYADPELRKFMLQASAIDPRFKALPFIEEAEKLEVLTSLVTLAESLDRSCSLHTVVKLEPDQDTDREVPELPNLPEQVQLKQEQEPAAKKSAMESLFGDVFVVSHQPATKTKMEMIDDELRVYKGMDPLDINASPLAWWECNHFQLPHLAIVAKHFLGIPATSVPSERVFSTAGDIVTAQRASLLPENVDTLVFLKKNVQL